MLGRALGYEKSFPKETWDDMSYWCKLLFSDKISQAAGYTEERLREEKVINYTGQEEGLTVDSRQERPVADGDRGVCSCTTRRLRHV